MSAQINTAAPRFLSLSLLFGLLATPAGTLLAQPKAPPPPARYKVTLRYSIDSTGLTHVAQFDEMAAALKKHGFKFDPKLDELPPSFREDPMKNVLTGTVLSKNANHLIDAPFVQSVRLVPEKFALPKDPTARVQVELELNFGFSLPKQLLLADQVRALLYQFGFEEMVGYDHHGFSGRPNSLLRGSLPVDQLDTLIRDIRRQPSGWFGPVIPPEKLPEPFRQVSPILISRVVADTAPPRPLGFPGSRGDPDFEKIGPELWQVVTSGKPHMNDLRVEIILATTPPEDSPWRNALQKAAPRFRLEAKLGNVILGIFPAPYVDDRGKVYDITVKDDYKQVLALAKLPGVAVVRLPQPAFIHVDPAVNPKGDNELALKKSGLAALHQKGHKGKGVRLVVIDSDFRGWQEAVADGKLPKSTTLVDVTAEASPNLVPEPTPGAPDQIGHGTHCALAAALAAPEARIILVRINPSSPLLLKKAIAYLFSEYALSPSLAQRHDDIMDAKAKLIALRQEVAQDKKFVLLSYDDDREITDKYNFLGPVAGWTLLPRAWLFAREAELEKAEQRFAQRQKTFHDYLKGVVSLKGADVVSCSLAWNDGYPLGARSAVTKWLDDKFRPKYVLNAAGKKVVERQKPLWFQSAGNTAGQSWQGVFRDIDRNGVMEFAGPEAKLPPDSWSPELNFLAWQPYQGKQLPELPGNTRLRLSLQWTEPHDPAYFAQPGEKDEYLPPLTGLQVIILRQRDPSGMKLSQDDFEEVARSYMLPQRLDNYPSSATYELFVEWTTKEPGRYAVRVEKLLPSRWLVVPDKKTNLLEFLHLTELTPGGIRPLGVATLPEIEKQWELKLRLFVQAVGGEAARLGRPVFRDYSTGLGSVGVPADGRVVIGVGAAGLNGKAEAFSAPGPPSGMELMRYPPTLSYDRLDLDVGGKKGPAFGTSLATPFAAGTAAVILEAGTPADQLLEYIRKPPKK